LYYNEDAKRTKGMYRQRIQKASVLLDRTRDLIIHCPVHRSLSGAAMPTDKDGQYNHFFLNKSEREGGATSPPSARSLFYCCLDPIHLTEGGENKSTPSGGGEFKVKATKAGPLRTPFPADAEGRAIW